MFPSELNNNKCVRFHSYYRIYDEQQLTVLTVRFDRLVTAGLL